MIEQLMPSSLLAVAICSRVTTVNGLLILVLWVTTVLAAGVLLLVFFIRLVKPHTMTG